MNYTITQQNKTRHMTRERKRFHLNLDRSEYTSEFIYEIEPRLKEFALGEGETDLYKTSIDSIEGISQDTRETLWIENGIDDKAIYNGKEVVNIHWYNKQFYIIETK
jgi:hypothetical protein